MCDRCGEMTRRVFLGATGTTLATGMLTAGALAGSIDQVPATAVDPPWGKTTPIKVYVVYLGKGGAWPKPEFDAPAEIANLFAPVLDSVRKNLGDVEFIGGELIFNSVHQAQLLIPSIIAQGADAILIIHLSFGEATPFSALAATGLPVAIYSQPFSGHDWMYVPAMQREGMKIIMSPSRDISEVQRLVSILRVPARMKQTKLVLVGHPGCAAGTEPAKDFAQVKEKFGVEVIQVTPDEFVAMHNSVSEAQAIQEADEYWIKPAREIREPSREEIVKSCKTYLAMKQLMIDNGARGLTMKCLGGVPIDVLGYPCLGFARLLDDGAVGACEADIDSSLTMLMFLYAMGRPGFITDPLIDLAKNAAIHAHCVCPTKMDGPCSERLPFSIRTHRDDNQGASLKVFMDRDMGREVTWSKVANNNSILVSTGKIVEICDFDDRGCRSQVVTEVTSSSARELLDKWGGNVLGNDMMTMLHRVLFYGNHLDNFRDIAQLMGLKFMIEGKDWA